MLDELITGTRFFSRLPSFLRHPISLEEARAILRQRLGRREADFLSLVRESIYRYPQSPYRQLLGLAGIEYGDLEKLVVQDGVEGALRTLFCHGVYLTVEEFKGRRPVVRGSATLTLGLRHAHNPRASHAIPVQSSGSRSGGTPFRLDFAFIRDRAVNTSLVLYARGGERWRKAVWGVPGGTGIVRILEFSAFGVPPVRWFSQIDPAAPGLHPRYRWSTRALRWGGLIAGIPLPFPEVVPLEDPLPILHWMEETLRAGSTPHLHTFASSAVRVCQVAHDAGIDLHGAQFSISSEPITPARLGQIRRTGAGVEPCYATMECGPIGYGCLLPDSADDLHVLHDLHALIQAGPDEARGLPVNALLISSLRPTAPFILLNVALGDHAVFARRPCRCPLERLGWTTHLQTIRSYEKLSAGGMTFLDTDLIHVLEEVLPARFGGGATDYQLVEDETADGHPRLRLLVHPRVGPADPAELAGAFLRAIGCGSGVERIMSLVWRGGEFLRVERWPPLATASGKVLHLHVAPKTADAGAKIPAR